MSELRTDPLTGRRVVIAEERAARPNEFLTPAAAPASDTSPRGDCPFCYGNEHKTPEAVYEARGDDGLWRQRVVPNKYPAFAPPDGPGDAGGYAGAHEVIIECRDHRTLTGQLTERELGSVLGVYAERLEHWRGDARFSYRLLFKNVGRSAGASLSHLHSQLVALPDAPAQVVAELENVRRQPEPGRAWEAWLEAELRAGDRLVALTDTLVAVCPRVSRAAYETCLLPRRREACFEDAVTSHDRREELSGLLHSLLTRIERRIDPAGYNLILHTAPDGVADVFHWRIEIVPRTSALAGFELATGVLLNTLSPERAAAELRG